MMAYFGICVLMGLVTEVLAYQWRLWLYRLSWVRIINIIFTFGVIYGLISSWLAEYGLHWQFLVGAGIGLVNEYANEYGFRAWYFPGRSVPWLKGNTALVVIGLGWGLVPPIAIQLHGWLI